MLYITVPAAKEAWDPINEIFIQTREQKLSLEHSLISISKWETKWHIPFLSKDKKKTTEQIIDYIRCMTITQNVPDEVFYVLSQDNLSDINKYIDNPSTATWFANTSNKVGRVNREEITSELVYYWMVTYQIPFECEKWHFNRLFTLIQICYLKNQPEKKMNKRDIMARNSALNAKRRQQYKSRR